MSNKKTRISIDVCEKDHKKIKIRAAKEGISIRQFVLGCIQEKVVYRAPLGSVKNWWTAKDTCKASN